MTITELQKLIHKDNIAKWWWEGAFEPLRITDRNSRFLVIEKLCLIHSEISEALEEIRDGIPFTLVTLQGKAGKPVGFPTELADAMIRILDLAEACGIDLGAVIDQKLAYNRTREYKHGGKLL